MRATFSRSQIVCYISVCVVVSVCARICVSVYLCVWKRYETSTHKCPTQHTRRLRIEGTKHTAKMIPRYSDTQILRYPDTDTDIKQVDNCHERLLPTTYFPARSGSRFDLTRNPSQNNKMNIFIWLLRVFCSVQSKNWHIIFSDICSPATQPSIHPPHSHYDLIMRSTKKNIYI